MFEVLLEADLFGVSFDSSWKVHAANMMNGFLDFSYMSSDGTQLIAAHDGMESHVSLTPGGLELIVKGDGGSKTIGSREFARYYRQRPRPSESRDGVLVNALVAR